MLRLLRHYPESGFNGKTIKALAKDYHEDMVEEHITPELFEIGIKKARRQCRFFPKVADLLIAINEVRDERHEAYLIEQRERRESAWMIEDQTTEHDLTPEEIAKYKERIKTITDMLAGKLTMEQAEEKVQPPRKFSGRMFKA